MEFRKVDPADYAKLLYEMDVAAFDRDFDYPSPSPGMTLKYLAGCEVYLAYVNDIPAGVLAFARDKERVEVKQILVVPSFQKKGYGREIMDRLKELARGERVWFVTHPRNSAAIILHLKSGYRITGWKDNYYGDGQPRIIFES